MIVLIDNYDSFSYNLVHYFQTLSSEVRVVRNDELTCVQIAALNPSAVVLSPGPSSPENAGICVDFVKKYAGIIPIFGVCLGMQSIVYALGGKIVRAKKIMHGKVSQISHNSRGVFAGLPNPLEVVRYHSLAADRESLPAELEVTAVTSDDGEIMAVKHRRFKLEGVQFHPESILTHSGKRILKNFLDQLRDSPHENA